MKGRESGMSDEAYWASFFDPHGVLDRLRLAQDSSYDVLEFGCGYGTFTLLVASRTRGEVTALDIEPGMVSLVAQRAQEAGLVHVGALKLDRMAAVRPARAATRALVQSCVHEIHLEQSRSSMAARARSATPYDY